MELIRDMSYYATKKNVSDTQEINYLGSPWTGVCSVFPLHSTSECNRFSSVKAVYRYTQILFIQECNDHVTP